MIGTLQGYALANGFDWYAFFIWFLSRFTFWSFSWYAPLTGTLGGTAGGVAFMNIYDMYLNDSLCEFPGLDSGIAGAGLCSA